MDPVSGHVPKSTVIDIAIVHKLKIAVSSARLTSYYYCVFQSLLLKHLNFLPHKYEVVNHLTRTKFKRI